MPRTLGADVSPCRGTTLGSNGEASTALGWARLQPKVHPVETSTTEVHADEIGWRKAVRVPALNRTVIPAWLAATTSTAPIPPEVGRTLSRCVDGRLRGDRGARICVVPPELPWPNLRETSACVFLSREFH